MTAPYDHEALWLKAKMFLNRAMDEHEWRPFDERALWASLALELLGKAALSRTSPLLIAEPTEDGKNMLVAAGLIQGDAQFTSARAKTIFSRCQRAFPPFSHDDARRITNARNEYLHGATPGFVMIPESAWWPSYWRQAVILNNACDRTIEDLVGSDREDLVETYLQKNKQNLEHRVSMLIHQAKTRLAQHVAGTLPAKVAQQWAPGINTRAGLERSDTKECPACGGAEGWIEGDYIADTDISVEQYDEGYWESTITLTVAAEYFSCSDCGLVLESADLIAQADLPETFDVEGSDVDVAHYGEEYGND